MATIQLLKSPWSLTSLLHVHHEHKRKFLSVNSVTLPLIFLFDFSVRITAFLGRLKPANMIVCHEGSFRMLLNSVCWFLFFRGTFVAV